jgi:6-pyruvoyltetrahydropterin/6-carboxytetrahydropterin synthase
MFTITKQFAFEASHQLDQMPEGHQCKRLHGHSYRVEVVLQSQHLDDKGMVVDYGDLDPFGVWLKETFDHRHLNDVFNEYGFAAHTTAENLAWFMFQWLWNDASPEGQEALKAVRVSETQKTWAEYRLRS